MAISTNGGIMKRPMIRGKSVDEGKKRKVKGLIPSFSYHFKVKAMSNTHPTAKMQMEIRIRVLVSFFRRKIEYIMIPMEMKTDPTRASSAY